MSESRYQRPWQRRLLGPVVLIALGVLLLLNNLGVVSWEVWRWLWQLWPVLLVLLGLELLLTGSASWGAVLFAIIALFIGSVIAAGPFGWFGRYAADAEAIGPSTPFSQTLDGAEAATVDIDFGAGRLVLGSGAQPGNLVEGELQSTVATLSRRYVIRDGVGSLDLSLNQPDGPRLFFNGSFANRLDLRFAADVPLRRLGINTGAAETSIDLTELHVEELNVQTGASHTTLRLPAQGQVTATVKAGASGVEIEIPSGVAARIRVDGGLSGVSVDERRFPPVDAGEGLPGLAIRREYRSPDYGQAEHRVDLSVSSGAAGVDIR